MSLKFGILIVAHAPLRAEAADSSEMVTQLLFGESVEILNTNKQWVFVRCLHDNYEGWMDHKQIFSCNENDLNGWKSKATHRIFENTFEFSSELGSHTLYKGSLLPADYTDFQLGELRYKAKKPMQIIERNHSVIEYAQSYLNTPYLWGGRSFTGMDCSGFTQMVFAFLGKQLPRDASQQINVGQLIPFEDHQAGDLAFFKNENGKIIHVGMATGQGTILHAHGQITEDFLRADGIYKKQNLSKSHDLHAIKRV